MWGRSPSSETSSTSETLPRHFLCLQVGALVLSPLPRTGALLWRRQGLSSNSTASDSNSNSSSNSNSNSLGLPSNSTALLPLPLPLGGALVVSDNALVWLDQAPS